MSDEATRTVEGILRPIFDSLPDARIARLEKQCEEWDAALHRCITKLDSGLERLRGGILLALEALEPLRHRQLSPGIVTEIPCVEEAIGILTAACKGESYG